ncbi:MAG: alpha/beta fold hydrolase, partial [bacterium]|nr:alpha/beta fold hydrolase [bacterium]
MKRNMSAVCSILSKISIFFFILLIVIPAYSQEDPKQKRMENLYVSTDPADHPERDFERGIRNKARTDSIIFAQCEGVVDVQKTKYRSKIDDMDIPVYIFQPLEKRGPKGHAALVWVHGGVHGDFTEMYFRFVPEAVKRGYIVLAPEYRGSTGYGPDHYFAIDYGGYEVDDCLTAVDHIVENMPHVDPDRIGIWGLSHGGFIALHSVFRDDNP